jgi:hypothetical protein
MTFGTPLDLPIKRPRPLIQISPLGLILESVITHLHEKKISTVHEGVRRNPSTAFQTLHARLALGSSPPRSMAGLI